MTEHNQHSTKRRKFDPVKNTRVVLEGLSKQVSVTELCRREEISSGRYYCWRKMFIEAGKKLLSEKEYLKVRVVFPMPDI